MSLSLRRMDRRLRSLLGVTLTLAVIVVSSSCDQEEDEPSGVFFPTWTQQPGAATPTGTLPGRLEESNGCLLWSNETDFLPVWPDDFQLDEAEVTIAANSGVVLAIGDGGTLAGGERTLEQAESLSGGSIPRRCQPAGGYWMVTELLPE